MVKKHNTGTCRHRWQHLRASFRDTAILLGEFRSAILWFSVAILGGGILFYFLSNLLNEPVNSLAESIYIVLTITFLQPPNRDFPHHIRFTIISLFHAHHWDRYARAGIGRFWKPALQPPLAQ